MRGVTLARTTAAQYDKYEQHHGSPRKCKKLPPLPHYSSLVGNRQKPKLVIRAFKKPPSLPASFYESTSALLLNSSKAILKRTDDTSASTNASAKPISREELYRACESCVVHKFSERLYISLKDLLAQHLKTVAEDLEEKTKRTVKTEVRIRM